VIFVLGGISYKELSQVQSLFQQYHTNGVQIILMSNNTICAEDLVEMIFTPIETI
jgi:hypothetical protein